MDSQEVGVWLEECLEAAAASVQPDQAREEARQNYRSTRDALCAELSLLLQEAVEMKWPFVPEKWQYKDTVSLQDKTNLSDLISRNLPELMALLKAAILAWEAGTALAVVFLLDRLLYWSDESQRLLRVTKLLHRRHRGAPVAPQLVIRQARVYLNSGKLQKAEFILSSLIINNGATGSWTYGSESDKLLVQAVSVQVRGLILQKLGLWLEAAELIWASLIGYFCLPQPDKKGIGTSLGVFANILVSMNDEDFQALKNQPDMDLSLLGDCSHRLLAAAEAARLAVVYSQYTSLYVLTNAVAQGTCLLSYSFSPACGAAASSRYLLEARRAFEVALLTAAEHRPVASQQELHTLLKAAYSLAVVHRWLGTAPTPALGRATAACREALALYHSYCRADAHRRDALATAVARHVAAVKRALAVEPYPDSTPGSFAPVSYGDEGAEARALARFAPAAFSALMERFRKYHESVCRSAGGGCAGEGGGRLCVTAIGTTETPEGPPTENCQGAGREVEGGGNGVLPPTADNPTEGESEDVLGSSWQRVGSIWSHPGSSGGSVGSGGRRPGRVLPRMHHTSTSSSSSSFELVEAYIDTADSEDGGPADGGGGGGGGGAARPMSALSLGSSLGWSFGSGSSWERVSRSGLRASPAPLPPGPRGPLPPTETPPGSPTEASASFEDLGASGSQRTPSAAEPAAGERNPACCSCQEPGALVSPDPRHQYRLTERDHRALLAGVCHDCLLRRLQSKEAKFKLKMEDHNKAYSGLHLKFSRATGLWTSRETCVFIGEEAGKGRQRIALWVQFLHQEERLSSYMGKDYQEPKELQFHLKDVERQMTSQYYVTQFNKRLYERNITAQIFFLPSDVMLILEEGEIIGCVTVEPSMLGEFVKLTNNTWRKDSRFTATEFGIAFGHFTYLFSGQQEVVVDLQGVVTANGKGLTYLTDPQIHSTRHPRDPSNFGERGIRHFLDEQHGPECNSVCRDLNLPPIGKHPPL